MRLELDLGHRELHVARVGLGPGLHGNSIGRSVGALRETGKRLAPISRCLSESLIELPNDESGAKLSTRFGR